MSENRETEVMMDKQWVDFKAVKAAVSMEAALLHYGVKVRRVNATYLRGRCPLPSHSSGGAKESFGVQTQKNAWACQSESCVAGRGGKKGGNVLDFVAAMEGCSVRDAALKLQDWFLAAATDRGEGSVPTAPTKPVTEETRPAASRSDKPMERNDRLAFALKGIDPSHPYLAKRGIRKETAEAFGVGFFPGKGSMSGRIVFPIENAKGDLVGYAGRSIDCSEPEYKFPSGFKKSLELFNLHRAIQTGSRRGYLVEGFFDAMKVFQAGYPCVVGLLGSSLSDAQSQLISTHLDEIVVMLDGNDAGRIGAGECALRLAPLMRVKLLWVPWGKEPDQLSSDEIRSLLK
jgi:DNA primase